jgi:hypothetical protein
MINSPGDGKNSGDGNSPGAAKGHSSSIDSARPRALLIIGDNEMRGTNGRILRIAASLAAAGRGVDIMTESRDVHAQAVQEFKGFKGISVILAEPRNVSIEHGIALVNSFVKLTYDKFLPLTDLKLYKVTAFDDFRGHAVNFTFSDIDVSRYACVFMPLPSEEGPPSMECDIFYSTVCFFAKEKGVPVVGLEVFPMMQTPLIYLKVADYIVARSEDSRMFLESYGYPSNKILLMDCHREAYYIETIEDNYKNMLLEPGVKTGSGEFTVLVYNHHRLRICVKEILDVLDSMKLPMTVFFMKRRYVVRDVSEDDVIRDFYLDDIDRLNVTCRASIEEPDARGSLIMQSDVIISPSFLTTLEFASRYNKLSIVYNPLYRKLVLQKGVVFINDRVTLEKTLRDAYAQKTAQITFAEVADRVSGTGISQSGAAA